jgi:hypothetical protein
MCLTAQSLGEWHKSCLLKVFVECEGIGQFRLLHYQEAGEVCETPALILPVFHEINGFPEYGRIDPYHADALASVNLVSKT